MKFLDKSRLLSPYSFSRNKLLVKQKRFQNEKMKIHKSNVKKSGVTGCTIVLYNFTMHFISGKSNKQTKQSTKKRHPVPENDMI